MNTTTALIVAALAAAGLAVYTMRQRQFVAADMPDDEPAQDTTLMESLIVAASPSTYTPVNVDQDTAAANVRAFLDMIAYSEGTSGPDGYRYMFGAPRIAGRLITSYADHPRQYFSFTDNTGKTNKTSAAGRYQFLVKTWDSLKAKLGLQDFSPDSQDAACIELIRERGALNDVKAGRIQDAIAKCAPIWASLPGAGYNQPERKLGNLLAAFNDAGGYVA